MTLVQAETDKWAEGMGWGEQRATRRAGSKKRSEKAEARRIADGFVGGSGLMNREG